MHEMIQISLQEPFLAWYSKNIAICSFTVLLRQAYKNVGLIISEYIFQLKRHYYLTEND